MTQLRLKQKLVTFYVATYFLLSAVLVPIPVVWVYRLLWPKNEARRMQYRRFLSRYFRWSAARIPGVEIRIHNPQGEDFSRPAIIVSNHQSHLDLLVLLMLSPRIVAMTNRWVWRFPLYAPVIRYCQFYPAADGLENNELKIRSLLDRGLSVLIFPEGTRSADSRILRFRRGAFYLAERMEADILPLYLDGPGRVLPKEDFTFHSGRITIHFGRRTTAADTTMGSNYREQTRAWHRHYLAWEAEVAESSNMQEQA